jgi:hypothetical protein
MMSLSSHTFWIDYESGKLLESFTSGAQAKAPVFVQGDTAKVEIHLLRKNGSIREEIGIPAGATLKMGIGRIETAPTGGTFKLGYKGTASAEIAYNANATAIQSALNGIPAVASEGGISVAVAGDAFLLSWNSGTTHDPITSDPDALFPTSQIVLVGQVVGDVQKVLLHLQQSPVAFLQTFTSMGEPELDYELIATIGSKKVYRISISPNPAGGSFYISGTNPSGTLESGAISVNATSADVLNALPATIITDASVSKSGLYSWDVSISSANSLTADGSGIIGWVGVEGLLSLNTVQIHEFLNARENAPALLEFVLSESTGETTILQTPCTVIADLIDEGSIAPLDLTPPLSEGVANNRYVRKDTASAPSDATQDIIWQNLGVTIDGSTVVDAIDAASSPSGGNPFATMDDVEAMLPLSGGAISGNLTISGRAGIGGGLANNPAHKLAIYNGNIVFSSGYGLAFGDGTTQTTAATTPDLSGYATQSWVTSQSYLTASSLSGYATQSWVGSQGYITTSALAPYAPLSGATFSGQVNIGSMATNAPRTEIQTSSNGATISLTKGGSQQSVLSIGEAFNDVPFLYLAGSTGEATIHGGRFYSGGLSTGVEPYARKDGATFSGKVNTLAPTSTNAGLNIGSISSTSILTNSVAGDIWIGTFQLTYKNAQGNVVYGAATNLANVFGSPQIIDTTNAAPALRVTQKGTGEALRVEDSTTPDGTPFVVNADGAVGIGVLPGIYKLNVTGNTNVSGASNVTGDMTAGAFYSGSGGINFVLGGQITSISVTNNPNTQGHFDNSTYPSEIIITMGTGATFAIPARQITN